MKEKGIAKRLREINKSLQDLHELVRFLIYNTVNIEETDSDEPDLNKDKELQEIKDIEPLIHENKYLGYIN